MRIETDEEMVRAIRMFSEDAYWATKETKKNKKEHGFYICSDSQKLMRGNRCSGDACGVKLNKCREGSQIVGSLHTHPDGFLAPSMDDIVHSSLSREKFLCVASPKHIVRCWKLQPFSNDMKTVYNAAMYHFCDDEALRIIGEDIALKKGRVITQIDEYDVEKYLGAKPRRRG